MNRNELIFELQGMRKRWKANQKSFDKIGEGDYCRGYYVALGEAIEVIKKHFGRVNHRPPTPFRY